MLPPINNLKDAENVLRLLFNYLDILRQAIESGKVEVVASSNMPAAGVSRDGLVVIEDAGTGDRNLVLYAGGQRFRIDGGPAV